MRNSLGVDIAELLPGARSVVVDWVVERERSRSNRNETQHLYNVNALGCALLNPTYEYNKRLYCNGYLR